MFPLFLGHFQFRLTVLNFLLFDNKRLLTALTRLRVLKQSHFRSLFDLGHSSYVWHRGGYQSLRYLQPIIQSQTIHHFQ